MSCRHTLSVAKRDIWHIAAEIGDKFRRRFTYLEEKTIRQGRDLHDMTLEQMDEIWDEAKARGL